VADKAETGKTETDISNTDTPDTNKNETVGETARKTQARAGEAAKEVRAKASAAAQKTRRKASTTTKRAASRSKKQVEKVADEIKDSASEDGAGDLGSKVRERAQSAKQRVEAEAERGFEQGKKRVVSQVQGVAEALRKTGEQLRQEDQTDLAGYTDRLANSVENVSSYLDQKGVRGAVSDLEGFARQRPGLFVGGALAVGLVAARFLRSSGNRR
jgi:ElaB/YqjD/DUF883 family membrane-anchored ribosome-binding protein